MNATNEVALPEEQGRNQPDEHPHDTTQAGSAQAPAARQVALLDFFAALFRDTDGFLEFRSILNKKVRRRFEPLPLRRTPRLANDRDQYFGICPRVRQSGTANDVEVATALWADVDGKGFGGNKAEALRVLRDFGPLTPSVIVDTGHGFHGYWLLAEPLPAAEACAWCRSLAAAISPALDNVADAARILRVPGTFNVKNGESLPVLIVQWAPERRFDTDELESLLGPIGLPGDAPLGGTGEKADGQPPDRVDPAQVLAGVPHGKRNAALFKYAASLRARGVQAVEAEHLLSVAASKCDPPYDEEPIPHMVARVWARYEPDEGKGKDTIAAMLLRLVQDIVLVHSTDGGAWAVMPDGRALRLDAHGGRFAAWLRERFLSAYHKPARGGDVHDVVGALIGQALAGPRREVFTRIAEHGGNVYLDLGRADTMAVEITADGWHVVDRPLVLFGSSSALASLPVPDATATAADLGLLVDLLALPPDDALLATAWLLGTLQPGRSFPVLLFTGPAGSGKSTRERLLRLLVDPAGRDGTILAGPPRDPKDLFAAAAAAHVLALDNLSHVPGWLSDHLSSMTTGAGQMGRRLWTDNDLALVQVLQPVLINGVTVSGLGSDLMDRAIVVSCRAIENQQTEAELWTAARAAAPRILAGLLDAAVMALRNRAAVRIPASERPRMLDFAVWVKAAEPALHLVPAWRDLDFLSLYRTNKQQASQELLDADPIGGMLRELARRQPSGWKGTPVELLDVLQRMLEDQHGEKEAAQIMRGKRWPKSAAALGARVQRLASQLKAVGVIAEKDHDRAARRWLLYEEVPF